MKGKRITIQLADGSILAATVLFGSGDNLTVCGDDGYLYEIDRNIRNDHGAYIARG